MDVFDYYSGDYIVTSILSMVLDLLSCNTVLISLTFLHIEGKYSILTLMK